MFIKKDRAHTRPNTSASTAVPSHTISAYDVGGFMIFSAKVSDEIERFDLEDRTFDGYVRFFAHLPNLL